MRGAVSDEAVQAKTGQPLAHWFAVLDSFGAKERGHRDSARHLQDDHGVPPWYAQNITVSYERAHGLRVVNQGSDGKFQVAVSRVIQADVGRVVQALVEREERRAWLAAVPTQHREGLEDAFAQEGAVTFVDERYARARFRMDGGTVELRISQEASGKSTVVFQHLGLTGPDAVEQQRTAWRTVGDSLRKHLQETSRT
jgi:hypothetical protein